MKTLKLVLPDQTYQIAVDLASVEEVEVGQFVAGVLGEALNEISQKSKQNEAKWTTPPTGLARELPDTVSQLRELCRCVWKERNDFGEALRTTADKFKVLESTVRDKCTRRINVPSISIFLELISQPQRLVEHLCQKFPPYSEDIRTFFEPILPGGQAAETEVVPRTPPPPRDIAEIELVAAIIKVLKRHGGRLDKSQVEQEVFEEHKELFRDPWYQQPVGGGVPRWQKNVQFARNTACNTLGLIKPPEEAGRGVWELTEKGRIWQPD